MSVNKLWIFQDESGEPGKSPFFITGYVRITSEEKNRLLKRIQEIRDEEGFYNEFHYQTFSDWRLHVYKRAIDAALDHNIYFKCIVIRREFVDLKKFGNERHRAYNYFSKLVIFHGIKHRDSEHVHIRVDDKNRLKQDNFLKYLHTSLNYESLVHGCSYQVRSVKPQSSKSCDLLQITDLLVGAVKCHFEPAGSRKIQFSNHVLRHSESRRKINIWDWKPRNFIDNNR